MTYVMSDLHGNYESYRKMFNLIGFSGNDTLYLLGDICDRGPEPEKIYIDIMNKSNIFCLKGNHETMAEGVLPYLLGYRKKPPRSIYEANYRIWMQNGGESTVSALYRCREKTQMRIVDYIEEMPFVKDGISLGGREFILVHAGLDGYTPEKEWDAYTPYDLVWARPDYDAKLWEEKNKYLIVGHTPTLMLSRQRPPEIYKGKGNIINIDCGLVYRSSGGRLACLCLDNMEVFYV